ncbi:hypothetical protein [Kribbella sp. NBC_00359]|uniref:hypothetical protein n=1 Tax=Kribbella sp. NBC_00359 TaxID=2975966 RepID=UPI002E1EC5FC
MTEMLQRSFESVAPSGVRAEIINAIADLALAARAGTLLRPYHRDFSWVDQENYRDLVDADTFNAAFHDIEREFDKLTEILAQGSGPSMEPDFQQVVTLSEGTTFLTLEHGLGTMNLLVDLQAGVSTDPVARRAVPGFSTLPATTQQVWSNFLKGVAYAFALVDDDHIMLVRGNIDAAGVPFVALFDGDLMLQIRAWKLG